MESFHFTCANSFDQEDRFLALLRHWRQPDQITRRCWILVPHLNSLATWKRRLIEHGIPLFNVEFFLPNTFRRRLEHLLAIESTPLRGREENLFLIQQTARLCRKKTPTLESLGQDGKPLLAAIDELEMSGHSVTELRRAAFSKEFDEWIQRWAKDQPQRSSRDRAAREQQIWNAAETHTPFPVQFAVLGFDLNTISSFSLIRSGLRLSEQKAVFSLLPLEQDESLQQIWISLVESWLPQASLSLDEEKETASRSAYTPNTRFYAAPRQCDHIELLLRLIKSQLNQSNSSIRIGCVFSRFSAVAGELPRRLRREKIPFYSEFEAPLPLNFDQSILHAWLVLQREGLFAEEFLDFWKRIITVEEFWKKLSAKPVSASDLTEVLQKIFGQCLSDRVDVLAAAGSSSAPAALIAFVEEWKAREAWPEEAPLALYIEKFSAQLDWLVGPHLGREIRAFLQDQLQALAILWPTPVVRADATRLIESFIVRPEKMEEDALTAAVVICSAASARHQTWDHLILAQVNEGEWPASPSQTSVLDDTARNSLNRASQIPSPQGGDEFIFAPGKFPLLTDSSRYQLARANFFYLCESARHSLVLTATAWDEVEGHRQLYPSELFRQAWENFRQQPWSEGIWETLLKEGDSLSPASPHSHSEHAETSHAYHTRRDVDQPFGPFQFVVQPRPRPRDLNAVSAEKILTDPAAAWFEIGLEISSSGESWDSEDVFQKATGSWIHRSIASAFQACTREKNTPFAPLPSYPCWRETLEEVLAQTSRSFHQAYEIAGQPIPAWWPSEWQRIGGAAHSLLKKIYELEGDQSTSYLACEYEFALPLVHSFPVDLAFSRRTRADIICLDAPDWNSATRAHIIDFKTGPTSKTFSSKELLKSGKHFQLLVYAALARLQHSGSLQTQISVVTRRDPADSLESMEPFSEEYLPLWHTIQAAWKQGVWGQALPIRKRFHSTSSLPLATLEIDDAVLASKWASTPVLCEWTTRFES